MVWCGMVTIVEQDVVGGVGRCGVDVACGVWYRLTITCDTTDKVVLSINFKVRTLTRLIHHSDLFEMVKYCRVWLQFQRKCPAGEN